MSAWDTLSEQLMALDFAAGSKVSSPLDVQGDDDDEAHLDTLSDAADKVRASWKKVQKADEAVKKKVRDAAAEVLETSKDLAEGVIRHLPHTVATEALYDKAQAVKAKIEDTAKKVLPWYLAIGAATWVGVGVVAYLLWSQNEKQKPERMRIAREYADRT